MKIVNLKREVEQSISMQEGHPGQPFDLIHTTDGGLVGNMVFKISDLPGYTELTGGLFKQYKINAVKMTIYSSSNFSQSGTGVSQDPALNTCLLGQTCRNLTGTAMSLGNTREDWNQIQSKRRFTLYKKKSFYFKLAQKGFVSESLGTATGYTIRKPGWIHVSEPHVDHFGLNLRIDSVDGVDLSVANKFPYIKVIYTYYISCRGIR